MKNKITLQKITHYQQLTSTALEKAEKAINKSEQSKAKEILIMVKAYLSDSKYFQSKEDYINAFAAINYAHGWLDCGARLGIFKVKDTKLFTIK